VQGVTGSGEVKLEFAGRDAGMPEKGEAKLVLDGWIPPHPVELDGFVFGKTTTVESQMTFAADGKRVDLTGTRITAGRFTLSGGGTLTREETALTLALDLAGALPCDALAAAAAESRLGRLLGREMGVKGGNAARQVVGGSVSVRILVNGTTADLANAKVTRSIGIGCGLKPLTLEELLRIGEGLLPTELSHLPDELERITGVPKGTVPALPSGLPALPKLPSALIPPPLPPFPSALRFPIPAPRPSRLTESPEEVKPAASAK
jgi:hypothetical protein